MSHGDDAFDMRAAPMRIGRVRLRVRDLAAVARFYRDVIGLAVLQQGEGSMLLGTVSAPLLELVGDPSLRPRDGRGAGLFHVAFLLPAAPTSGAGSRSPAPTASRCTARPTTASARRSTWRTRKATASRSTPITRPRAGAAPTARSA